jgi:toluene monooxygenase system ferredoxin subunit
MVTVDALRNTELFQDLSDETLRAIADLAKVASYEDGDSVYELGDDADDLYLVDSGRVRFSLGVGNRPDASGSVMAAGIIFGWAALLEAQPRRLATATCLESSRLLAINGRALLQIFDRDTAAGYTVMRRLAAMIARNFMETLSS